ncbi:MAG: hypothetical protein JSW51_09020 [Gemmatimonadota bacterium]|nr:MAG: hypothetical protein JSW51_09020 [Gemmatimonadota bacterium]
MKRYLAIGIAAASLVGTACLEESDGFLYIGNLSSIPPDTTYEETVRLSGQVVRTPPRQDVFLVVTVTGGTITVSDTATQLGIFDVTIPLNLTQGDTTDNNLIATASDGIGSPTPNPWTKTVVQIDTTSPPPSDED